MKVAIITDQHFGARKNSKHFHEYFLKFYENIFFPAIEEEGFLDVSVSCITDAAQQVGWRSPESVAKLETAYHDLSKEHERTLKDLAKAKKALGLVKELKKK